MYKFRFLTFSVAIQMERCFCTFTELEDSFDTHGQNESVNIDYRENDSQVKC